MLQSTPLLRVQGEPAFLPGIFGSEGGQWEEERPFQPVDPVGNWRHVWARRLAQDLPSRAPKLHLQLGAALYCPA